MKIFTFSTIGQFHTEHNEDAYVVEEIGRSKLMAAVFDGCSSGIDSHFAATLMAKLLRKLARQEDQRQFIVKDNFTAVDLAHDILFKLFDELQEFQARLDLRIEELLSTVVLTILDLYTSEAAVLIAGDGVVCYNGEITEVDSDNKPDYIAYHLQAPKAEWFAKSVIVLHFTDVKDISICTDGVHTFRAFDAGSYRPVKDEEIISSLLLNRDDLDKPNKTRKTLIQLADVNGVKPTDDLTLIRIVLDR